MTPDGEDFSSLLETGRLEYYSSNDDRWISMHSIERNHAKAWKISYFFEANLVLHNSPKLLHQRYHFGHEIDIIHGCKAVSNSHLEKFIHICRGYFNVRLGLPMSAFIFCMMNYLQLAPHQLTCNSYVYLCILSDLEKHYGAGRIS